MPSKIYGKYRSRRKPKKGGGLLGDIGTGLNEIGKFVESSGKTVTDITAQVASAGGKAVSFIGDQIKDKQISKGFKTVGSTMSGTANDVVTPAGKTQVWAYTLLTHEESYFSHATAQGTKQG